MNPQVVMKVEQPLREDRLGEVHEEGKGEEVVLFRGIYLGTYVST